MKSKAESNLNTFLVLLVISLVGNSCADFAIIWHAIAQLNIAQLNSDASPAASSRLLSSFYVGQALGISILAPLLSVMVDRHSKRVSAIALDLTYALILVALILVHVLFGLSPALVFPFAVMTAALGMLHRSSIGFGALKSLSQELGVTSIVAKFSASLFLTNVVGSMLSGFAYRWLGLGGCLTLAILTFAPMPYIYLKLFPKTPPVILDSSEKHVFREFVEGFRFIVEDRVILWITICATVLNFASNIFPALVGIAFQSVYPGRSDLAATAVAVAVLTGVFAFKPLQKVAPKLQLHLAFPIALIVPVLSLVVCAFYPAPITFTVAFALQCCGAALCNILSGSLRVARVSERYTGRVNSAYMAIVFLGQILGSLSLISITESSLRAGACAILICFIVSAGLGFLSLPKSALNQLIKVGD